MLEEIGIEFLNEESLDLFKAGWLRQVDGCQCPKMGRDWVMEMVAQGTRPQFDAHARAIPDRKITLGANHILFGNVSSPPNYFDLEIGKKVSGTREQCANGC